ncbi:MAG: type II toxin-antitoxin system RelE/ParE family toxin [Pirellulaceae bacterium]|nr:type II toxin-antitoxin system RelE/ParE family toxin [Pirellulaceae bacterium]
MAKVIWTEPARDDLARIYKYLAEQTRSFDLAERICDEILLAALDRLATLPGSGSPVLEAREHGAREIYKHSYRIIYIQRGDACYVVRCIHGSRDLAQHLDPENWPKFVNLDDD